MAPKPSPVGGSSDGLPELLERFQHLAPDQLEDIKIHHFDPLLSQLKAHLEKADTSADAALWLGELNKVQDKGTRPRIVIGLLGPTGAGKSSLINALLDKERIVPTSGSRACTAVGIDGKSFRFCR